MIVNESSRRYYQQPESDLINKHVLPELLELAFSMLGSRDLLSAALVNKNWNTRAKNAAQLRNRILKDEKDVEITRFVQCLADSLIDGTKKNAIIEALKAKKSLTFANLPFLFKTIAELHEELLNILKTLNEKELKDLQKVVPLEVIPKSFADIFELAKIYRQIDLAEDDTDLKQVIDKLIDLRHLERATSVAMMLSDPDAQWIQVMAIASMSC